MPGDPFRTVRAGEPCIIHASAWNALMKMRADWAGNQQGRQGGRPKPSTLPAGWCRVKVDGTFARFGIVGLGDPVISHTDNGDEFERFVLLEGTTPATSTHTGRFAILQEPGEDDDFCRAILQGVAICQIDVGHSVHGYADVKNSDKAKLASGFVGAAEIIWKESGTGTKWAIVRLGTTAPPTLVGKCDASFAKDATNGTVSVHYWSGSAWTDTGANVTGCANFTAAMASGALCSITFIRGRSGDPWLPVAAPLSC